MPAFSQPPAHRPAVIAYYHAVGAVLLDHLRDRVVFGLGDPPTAGAEVLPIPERAARLHIGDRADLTEAVRSGVNGFALPGLVGPGMLPFHVTPGAGSGIDTVATAALSLLESMARDRVAAWALTDGGEGMFVLGVAPLGRTGSGTARGAADGHGRAAGYAHALAVAAPEIATSDPADAQGRALVLVPAAGGLGIPAPYSLVRRGEGLGVVAPLAPDDVAAVTAGMPLDIEPEGMAGRVAAHGDLAARLATATRIEARTD